MHDYGLRKNEQLIESYQWKLIQDKKVVMSNVKLCKNRITVNKIAKYLQGWMLPELELAEAVWLTQAVVNAIDAEQLIADVSKMFNVQFAIHGIGIVPKEAIAKKLYETLFKKIDENDEQITVKLNWWCLF